MKLNRWWWLAGGVACVAQAQALPPGHPPLSSEPASSAALGPASGSGALPPGHPSLTPGKEPPTSQELLRELDATKDLKSKDKTFDVAASLGKLYYSNGRFADAVTYLRQAVEKAGPLRMLYLAEEKKASGKLPDAASVGCAAASDAAMDQLAEKAKARAAAHEPAAAAACARAALRPALEAESLLGDALFLQGDSKGALAEHQRVLALDPGHPDSLYGHAGALLDARGDDVPSLKTARAELSHFLQLYPLVAKAGQARKLLARTDEAITAGGVTALARARRAQLPKVAAVASASGAAPAGPWSGGPMGSAAPASAPGSAPPALTREMVDAVQNTEMTPELVQGLEKLVEQGEDHLAHARYQDALDAYKRVVPFQPGNGRAKAGMAWALVGLQKPMGENIWRVAVTADAAAVDKLGDVLAAKGDRAGAQQLWKKLAATDPAYAERAGVAKKLP